MADVFYTDWTMRNFRRLSVLYLGIIIIILPPCSTFSFFFSFSLITLGSLEMWILVSQGKRRYRYHSLRTDPLPSIYKSRSLKPAKVTGHSPWTWLMTVAVAVPAAPNYPALCMAWKKSIFLLTGLHVCCSILLLYANDFIFPWNAC